MAVLTGIPQLLVQRNSRQTGYVLRAWDIALGRYIPEAIVRRAGQELYDTIKEIIPGLLYAVGGIVVTTLIGAGVGSVFPVVGTAAGAAAGFALGMLILRSMGLGFLIYEVVENVTEIGEHLIKGTQTAWESNGNESSLDEAAREMAEGIGILFAVIIKAVLGFIAMKGVNTAITKVSESHLGPKFGNWVLKRLSLNGYLRAIDKPPGEYVFTKDHLGRPMEAEGWLLKQKGKHDSKVHEAVTDGLPLDANGRKTHHASHLIPDEYYGASIFDNLVPLPILTNTSWIRSVETFMGRLQKDQQIYLKVKVQYSDNGKVPNSVTHEFWVMGKEGMELKGSVHTSIEGSTTNKAMGKILPPGQSTPLKPKDFLDLDPNKGTSGTRH